MAKKSGGKSRENLSRRSEAPVAVAITADSPNRFRTWLTVSIVLLLAIGIAVYVYRGSRQTEPVLVKTIAHAEYVGGKTCNACHAEQAKAWKGSDHDLSMQIADAKTVLGNFDNASFSYAGVSSRFFKRDGRLFVSTDGSDGKLADFEIKYTFGVRPLQQYLIEMPGGRLQAFGIAWDSRARAQGGQRWFHLYPKDVLKAGDALHWTGVNQNWNFMCSECHSTALAKNFDAKQEVFHTTWKEINVSCEACHGPASKHLAWAEKSQAERDASMDNGLINPLNERRGVNWLVSHAETPPQMRTAASHEKPAPRELDTCARCHARASRISDDYVHGQPPLNTHIPSLISSGLYWNDGQQRDEVFTSGSFAQSKMHAKGVICSNCHEPHSLKLRAAGNAVCTQCHAAEKFDATTHTHHATTSTAATCTACHMPTTTYMQVDPRHDHSLRIPRPDLSEKFGLAVQSNACNGCHSKQTAAWAAAAVRGWMGGKPLPGFQTFAASFHAAANGEPQAVSALQEIANDKNQAAIVRASAVSRLSSVANASVLETLLRGLNDNDAQVRLASVNALAVLPLEERRRYLARMLNDTVLAVRTSAARALAGEAESGFSAGERTVFDAALKEYLTTLDYNADRPESQLSMGNLWSSRGDAARAEQHYWQAINLDRSFVEGYVNLADSLRSQADGEAQAEQVLREGLKQVPKNSPTAIAASLHYALGLNLVRQKRHAEAIKSLSEAVHSDPNHARYAYVLGVALHSTGDVKKAMAVLEAALAKRPNEADLLVALAQFSAQSGQQDAALRYVGRLQAIAPENAEYRQLAAHIVSMQAGKK